jgi:hypothetical protein
MLSATALLPPVTVTLLNTLIPDSPTPLPRILAPVTLPVALMLPPVLMFPPVTLPVDVVYPYNYGNYQLRIYNHDIFKIDGFFTFIQEFNNNNHYLKNRGFF